MSKRDYIRPSVKNKGIQNSQYNKRFLLCAEEVNKNFDLLKQGKITKEEYKESIKKKMEAKEELILFIKRGF